MSTGSGEHPHLVHGSTCVLAPGMTTSNVPGIDLPGSFGVRIEAIVAIIPEGPEVFGPMVECIEEPFGPG